MKLWTASIRIHGAALFSAARTGFHGVLAMPGWVRALIAVLIAALVVAVPAGSALAARAASTAPSSAAGAATAASGVSVSQPVPAARHVIVIGISGLRWSDISPAATPALWRLAERGSVGSLVVTAVRTYTCPADAWLTLNSGARATATQQATGCRMPEVIQGTRSGQTGPALVPALDEARPASIESVNKPFSYAPCWGVLAGSHYGGAGCPPLAPVPAGSCSTAIGPGAALALANSTGEVQDYTAVGTHPARSLLSRCALTVVDLGALPGADAVARAGSVRAADAAAGQIIAAAPAGTIIVVAGMGDDTAPHVHAIIVAGPGFGPGLLAASSTRQPGLAVITDLTPTILAWLGRNHANLVGSVFTSSSRGTLSSTVRMLVAQDTAAQVYRSTLGIFFLVFGFTEFLVFVLIALLLRGTDARRTRRRLTAYRVCGVSLAAVPAGTFLASLVPWAQLSHPALALYGLGLAWAVVIAAAALAGPWRRDPFGSAGFVCAVTAAVIAADVITGSHLQVSTPFGLPVLVAGRWYGIGNNALGVYATAAIICATWAGLIGLRAGSRTRALLGAAAIAVVLLVACASPAWGAKVGGTVAMTPALALVLLAIAGVRVTPLRAGLIAVSGLVVITAFAVLSYIFPAVGVSDIGAFVGHVLHGSAGAILNRKATANLHSVTETWFTPIVPVLVAASGAMIVWPERFRLRVLARATAAEPMLRPMLTAIWAACVLGWLADDSGVSVTAAALPLALPLAIVIVALLGEQRSAGGITAAAQPGRAQSEGPVQAPGRPG